MSLKNDTLWQRISAYQIDKQEDKWPFSSKLAHEQGWTAAFTGRAIEEYKRFVYLCCVSPEGASPPTVVDEVWHLHLTYTVDYWGRFCKEVLGRELHHHPSKGGIEEDERHSAWYARTLELYEDTFGEKPPEDIWPAAMAVVTEPMDFSLGKYGRQLLLLLIPFATIWCMYGQPNPFRLVGPHFLIFYSVLAGCCFASMLLYYQRLIKPLKYLLGRIEQPSIYELAFIAGGRKRLTLLLITELINKGVIVHLPDNAYRIDHSKLSLLDYQIAAKLSNRDLIGFESLEVIAENLGIPYTVKYRDVKGAFVRKWEIYMPATLMILIGISRIVQGISNGRPVGYLTAMVILSIGCAAIIVAANSFHATCTRIFRNDAPAYLPETSDELTRFVIFSGFATIAMFPSFSHLNRYFGSAGDGSGGSCGGGSCGGGGCGGGCGGCGGG